MDRKKRYQELLQKREWARDKLDRAKKALGAGSWHEDSSYELADQDFRVWTEYLENIEIELREIETHIKNKKGIEPN